MRGDGDVEVVREKMSDGREEIAQVGRTEVGGVRPGDLGGADAGKVKSAARGLGSADHARDTPG